MSKFFSDSTDALPSTLSVSWEQITKWWEYWMIWRFAGKSAVDFRILANWNGPIPKSMADTFAELDSFYSKMESQHLKELAKKETK